MRLPRRRIDITGLSFGVVESPRPPRSTAPLMVLIHGIGMSHRYLSRLHDVLAESTRVVSVDLPGFAGLPKPSDDVDVTTMGRALADVVATFDEDRIVWVGHSMGAQWVIEAAIHRPDAVAAVVIIGPVADEDHRSPVSQAAGLTLDTLGETPSINAVVLTDYLRCGVAWYLRQLRHMLAYPIEKRLRRVDAPVLVMRGGRDPIAGREWCRRLRDQTRVSRLVEVPGHHHVVQQSASRAVADGILFHTESAWPDAAAVHARSVEPRA